MDYSKFPYWRNQTPPRRGVKFTDDIFPPNENSLIGKDSNGNFIDPVEGANSAKRIINTELKNEDVVEKKKAAMEYCSVVSKETSKPWQYVLIPHDAVGRTLQFRYVLASAGVSS